MIKITVIPQYSDKNPQMYLYCIVFRLRDKKNKTF